MAKKEVNLTPEEAAMDHVDQSAGKRDGGIRRTFSSIKERAKKAGKFVADHGGKAFGFGALAAGGALIGAKLCGYELVPSELILESINAAKEESEELVDAVKEAAEEVADK